MGRKIGADENNDGGMSVEGKGGRRRKMPVKEDESSNG